MQAVEFVARKLLEQAVGDHGARAAKPLLGRLEDEGDAACEVAGLRKIARRTEQHGRVAVVAAGMHGSGLRGAPRQVGGFLDRQRVHVGAQPKASRPFRVAMQDADDAGLAQAAMNLDSVVLEFLGDERRCAHLLETDFGMGVDVTPDRGQFVGVSIDAGKDRIVGHVRIGHRSGEGKGASANARTFPESARRGNGHRIRAARVVAAALTSLSKPQNALEE